MRKPVYLDYAASTPVDPAVAALMVKCLTIEGNFANPASRSHMYGWHAEEAVELARGHVSSLLSADPREVVWTSGATESNNLAIKGIVQARRSQGKHIVTSKIEHKAVLDTCAFLEEQGFDVTYLQPDQDGMILPNQVIDALRSDTVLVSLMHVNNEIGVINPIFQVGEICRNRDVIFHVDAAQSAGKLPIDVNAMCIDLLSVSAHKMYGPKGVGALYVRRNPKISVLPQIHGGGHERGMRSGTLATHQLAGFGEAAKIAQLTMDDEQARISGLSEYFLRAVKQIEGVTCNGSQSSHVPGIVNLSFSGVDGETLLAALRDLAVSTGSACTSASVEPSYVLKAIGVCDELAHSALRFSFGRFTTQEDIDFSIDKVKSTLAVLKKV